MRIPICLFASLALSTAALAQEVEWIQDFAKAKEKAKAEKKHLLVDFTGSDWCGWCIRLDEEVFTKEAFQKEAPKHFVLVKLDFPQDESRVTEAIKKQNEELSKRYQVQGFPTILLTDADGVVYGQTGYQEGGPDAYNTMLADLRKKGDAFLAALTRANAAKGADRAKALDEAIGAIDEETAANHHFALMEEICKLDEDGKAGLKGKHEQKVKDIAEAKMLDSLAEELQQAISPAMQSGEHDKALAALDEVVKAPKNTIHHQLALFFKGMVIMEAKEDAKAAIEQLEAAKKLKPGSPIGKQIEMILPQLKKMAEAKDKENGGK